jgi:hypothetical protein
MKVALEHLSAANPAGSMPGSGYHPHQLMDMYSGMSPPAINTMDWKNTSQVGKQSIEIAVLGV